MATKTIKELDADGRRLALEIKAIHDKGDDATLDELESLEVKSADAEKIAEQLEKYMGKRAGASALNRLENTMASLKTVARPGFVGGDGVGSQRDGQIVEIKTVGQALVEDERWQNYIKSIVKSDGTVASSTTINSPSIEVKTLLTSAADVVASRPMLGQADRREEIVPLGWTSRVVRQLITNLTTNSDTVEVVREKSRTNNAATVSEATDVSNGTGEKPQSAIDWEVVQAVCQVISHWIAASSRILSDARRLRGETDTFLREGIEQEVERLILVGSGTGTEFTGVNNTSGILTQSYTTSLLVTTRKARTNLKVNGFVEPTAYVFTPADWETIDLSMDGENRFYFGGPAAPVGKGSLWGVPVVDSTYQSSGYSMLGRWSDAVLYDRESTTINVSNSHADFFIRNMVAILAEMRAAFHVRRPKSFVRIAHS